MKFLISSLLVLVPAAAVAQIAPNPAQVGITSTATPEVVQVLDHTGAWVSIGSIASGTFTPIGGLGSGTGSVISSIPGTIGTFTGPTQITGTIPPGVGIVSGLGSALNGSGALVGTTSPSLVTPNLGTPSAVNLLHATNIPVSGLNGVVPITAGGTGVTTLPTGPLFGAGTSPIATGTVPVIAGGTGATTLPAGPLFGAGTGPITAGTLAGTGSTKLATVGAGSFTSGHMIIADANSNLADGGVPPSGGAFPQTVSGVTTSGGVPYFSTTTQLSSSGLLGAGALVVGGGAGGAPATITTGAGVAPMLGNAPNAANGAVQINASGFIPRIDKVGTADGSSAAAGNIGEVVSASKNLAGATSVNNNTNAIVVQLTSLPAGAWHCSGNVQASPNSSTSINAIEGWISTTTPVGGSGPTGGAELAGTFNLTQSGINNVDGGSPTGVVYFNFASPTTVYLGAHFLLGAGTSILAYGRMDCLRIR